MIWEMVKDSPAWRVAAWISLFYAAGWLMLTQGDQRGVIAGAPLLVYMINMVAMVYSPDAAFRCTFFDAGLPVTGRQLWVSKMIVLLGGLWLPVLAASAVGFVVMRNPAMPFLEAAAGISMIYLFAQSFRIREFHEPRWACVTSLIVGGMGLVFLDEVLADSWMWVLPGYLLAGAALFAANLARVPKSFQCARPDAVTGEPVRLPHGGIETAKTPPVWWIVLRCLGPVAAVDGALWLPPWFG